MLWVLHEDIAHHVLWDEPDVRVGGGQCGVVMLRRLVQTVLLQGVPAAVEVATAEYKALLDNVHRVRNAPALEYILPGG